MNIGGFLIKQHAHMNGTLSCHDCTSMNQLLDKNNSRRTFQSDRKWSGTARASIMYTLQKIMNTSYFRVDKLSLSLAVDCGLLEPPVNGQFKLIMGVSTYRSVAKFSCNPGYYRRGSQYTLCQDNGEWNVKTSLCLRKCYTLS